MDKLLSVEDQYQLDRQPNADTEDFPFAWADERPELFPLLSWAHLDVLIGSVGLWIPFLIVERTDGPRSAQTIGVAMTGRLYVELLDGDQPFGAGRPQDSTRLSSVPTIDGYREPCLSREIWSAKGAATIMRAWLESGSASGLTLRRIDY